MEVGPVVEVRQAVDNIPIKPVAIWPAVPGTHRAPLVRYPLNGTKYQVRPNKNQNGAGLMACPVLS